MKTTRYKLEQMLQDVNKNSLDLLKMELKDVLESNKEYTRKCDYIGYGLLSIDSKISLIDEQIKELQEYKSKLKLAKDLAYLATAEVFNEYGISKLEGAGISSLSIMPSTTTTKTTLIVVDSKTLIDAGFYKKVLDEEMVIQSFNNNEYVDLINKCSKIEHTTTVKASKIRVNRRRGSHYELIDVESTTNVA